MTASDTIFALSSGAGRSALAVVRLSGPACGDLLACLMVDPPAPRQFSLRTLRDPETGEVLDQAVVVSTPGPRSFTGEDAAELHIHGSPAVISALLATLGKQPGVRPAQPGEFTRRAFLNGKMDLVEVEGLADLIESRTASQRRQALRQLSGESSGVFHKWRQQLLLIRADIEAVVDFADEPGVAEEAAPGIDQRIRALISEISAALERASVAEVIRDGVRVVLAGAPNTGKSSLLNALARREAAIVSDVPGTTRDAIEVMMDIRGIPVILTDTAGIRGGAADKVEEEGIRRSRQFISGADIVVWVCSPDIPGSHSAGDITPDLLVLNKSDLDSGLIRNDTRQEQLAVSTLTMDGIASFIEHLALLLEQRYGRDESAHLVSARQAAAAQNSIRFLNESLGVPLHALELKAEQIRLASDEIGRLTGKLDVEEWLGAIFSRFCIGK